MTLLDYHVKYLILVILSFTVFVLITADLPDVLPEF